MREHFKPTGDTKQGFRIAIPAIVKRASAYKFEQLPDGTLVYTPVKT
jgi:hypothetical protein